MFKEEMLDVHADKLIDLPLSYLSKRNKKDDIFRKDKSLLPSSHTHKESKWISYYPRGIDDVPILLKQFRLEYQTALL